ncbi:MAG: PEGA domain-containing protein [Polyangia bacterium]|jgi:hypothetical protein|nr:PEGA domain-containing protein [Polyangia bacterium]
MRSFSTVALLALVTLVAPVLGSGVRLSSAAPADPKALAKKHFERGELFYQQGDFRKALGEYKTAQQHFRHPAFIFNIAQCHRQLKEWERALFFYQLYLSEAPGAPNKAEVNLRIKEAKAKMEEARAAAQQMGRISVITRPEGASIRLDRFSGPVAATSPAILPVPAGQHLVYIEKAGFEKVHRTVTVAPGQISMLELSLTPRPGSAAAVPPREGTRRVTPPPRDPGRRASPPPGDDPSRAGSRPGEPARNAAQVPPDEVPPAPRKPFHKTWWFWTGLGGSVVLGVLGSMTGVAALASHKDFVDNGIPSELERAKRLARVTDSLLVLGAAAVLTTVVVTVIYEKRRKAERPSATLVPSCGPGGCGLVLTGRF